MLRRGNPQWDRAAGAPTIYKGCHASWSQPAWRAYCNSSILPLRPSFRIACALWTSIVLLLRSSRAAISLLLWLATVLRGRSGPRDVSNSRPEDPAEAPSATGGDHPADAGHSNVHDDDVEPCQCPTLNR